MINETIIDFMRKKTGYVSGEEISHRLGISRQALWKHIQEFKEQGYEIVAVPHLGYKLISSPDRLFPAEVAAHLQTKCIGKKIYYFDEVPSTMDVAADLGLKGAHEGTVILAELQTKGKGRLGRIWFSPRYKGAYFSLILKPRISPNQAAVLTLLCAVSICEAIKAVTGIEAQIKWPNDILINQKKVGGILTELNAEMDEIRFVVIGVGINVNNDRKSLISGATSLKEHKKETVGRVELLQEILRRIEKNYLVFLEKGSRPIIDKWREHTITLGKRVKIYSHHEHVEGEAVDIDNDGALLLRKDSGLTQKITSGDVVHCR
jgi:BirA family transcriptional regulator, biotin operon repressor / biotin---[acetyl-CoA-carboxylase] ligase